MKNIDAEAREHAERLIGYFQWVVNEYNEEVWQKGLSTAQEWLRLINTENASQTELLAFTGVVHANRYRTSGWDDLASVAYQWVQAKGVPVPSHEVFFAPEGLPTDIRFYEQTSLEHAQTLLRIFEEYQKEDPSSKIWAVGIELIQEWLRLMDMAQTEKSEVATLVKRVFDNQHTGQIWFDTARGVCHWCKENGHLDLIPDDYH